MHGRLAAQPKVGMHKCQLFKNYLRYQLKKLTEYGGHECASACQRKTKLVQRWHCNWHQCAYTFSPYTNSILTINLCISLLNIYLYIPRTLYRGSVFHTLHKSCHKTFSPAHLMLLCHRFLIVLSSLILLCQISTHFILLLLLWYFYGVSHSGRILYAGLSVIVSSYIAAWWLLLDDAEPLKSVESSSSGCY